MQMRRQLSRVCSGRGTSLESQLSPAALSAAALQLSPTSQGFCTVPVYRTLRKAGTSMVVGRMFVAKSGARPAQVLFSSLNSSWAADALPPRSFHMPITVLS